MDSRRRHSLPLLSLLINFVLLNPTYGIGEFGYEVIRVNYKFDGSGPTLSALRAHDAVRHLSIFAGVDLPLGGTGRPDAVGLYYAKIGIGTPSKDYYVQVDTGSDITWVNCIQCRQCPKKGYHGIELTLYNPKDSLTANLVSCNQPFCKAIGGGLSGCGANASCFYTEVYGDGSYSMGYFVEDVVQYDRVSGDLQTKSANGTVIFGCGAGQSGDLGSPDDALDGILGFGKSNSSMLSQLASSGKVKKMFAHCLDGDNGGGIFAIGHVVQPQVNTTPLVRDQPHYNVNMTAIQVGSDYLNLTTDVLFGDKKGAIIDSGTTLAYLPEAIYVPLVKKILSTQPDLKLQTLHDQYTCFEFSERVDEGFPNITLHFENSLSLMVYPHDYLFHFEDLMCIGWQNSGMGSQDKKNITVLGDLVLSNKLVLYDLEKQSIGWTEYNCSSSIQLKDEITGSVHLVGAHSLSRGCITTSRTAAFFSLVALLFILFLQSML
ncbi:aspartic proteinase 36 isoform X2 [Andrographis paniculata]|uniref:aspartic proteinase 36 isoform X2 n=1 Tax=Andrographis paniculata TaxID=175694 RepID=UPI0021E7C28A|nr:aspartic proteinase 36 isoform X2 [Andrographis paniculata]